jgi:hypothetical protein
MDPVCGGPSEPHEGYDVERAAYACQWQASVLFDICPGSAPDFGIEEVGIPPQIDHEGDNGADAN